MKSLIKRVLGCDRVLRVTDATTALNNNHNRVQFRASILDIMR